MCGATQGQKDLAAAQTNFYNELTQSYATQFAGMDAILGQLTASFKPILDAGINQEGFSAGEKQTLNTQATEQTAQGYEQLSEAVGENQAAIGGGNQFLPSGSNAQLNAEIGASAEGQESTLENQILEADYATGRQNYLTAAGVLGGVANSYNPAGFAGAANSAGAGASETENAIASAGNAWMGALGGAVGGLGGGALAKWCWIADVLYGEDSYEASLLRFWMWKSWQYAPIGRYVCAFYQRFGKQIARFIRKHPTARRPFKLLFDWGLSKAKRYAEGVIRYA